MTRILIVDDQPMYRIGLAAILGAQDDLTVVGEAGDGHEAIARARSLQPDVVLMDVRMPNLNGIEATRAIAAAANDGGHPTRVVMLTTFDIDDYVFDALRAGASGFLLKDATPAELVDAVRTVAGGDALLAPKVTRTLIEAFAQAPAKRSVSPTRFNELTEREREVFGLVAKGHSNSEISKTLFIAEQTTKSHVSRIMAKLHLRDRVHAVVLGYESGLITPGEAENPRGR